MNLLDLVLTVDVAASRILGWLFHESLYAAIVFGVVAVTSWFLRHRSAHLQLALWSMVLIRLVLPVDFNHPLAAGRVLGSIGGDTAVEIGILRLDASERRDYSANADTWSRSRHSTAIPWAAIGLMFWVVGASWTGIRMLSRRQRFVAIAREATVCPDPYMNERLQWWRRELGVRRSVGLVVTEEPVTPFTLGICRPSIILPSGLCGQMQMTDAAIAHEMAHVKRADSLWIVIQRLLHSLYFFHPLIWISGSRIDFERELQCDSMVLAAGELTARQYAGALVEVAGLHLGPEPSLGFTTPMRRITMRIESALKFRKISKVSRFVSTASVLVLGAFLLPLDGRAANEDIPRAVAPAAPAEPMPAAVSEAPLSIEAPPSPAEPAVAPEVKAGPPSPSPAAAPEPALEVIHPVSGARITLDWGPANHPFEKREFFHRGVDLAAPEGTPVVAASAGVVTSVLFNDEGQASGRYVVLTHRDGYSTYYGHLGEIEVEEGQAVDSGQRIASVGMTGKTTGPHVHFELRLHDDSIAPWVNTDS